MHITYLKQRGFRLAAGLLIAAVALLAAASAAAGPLARIDVTAAQPYVASPTYGTLVAPDYEALWSVSLAAGQQIIVTLNMPANEDFDLGLWPPGTVDFSGDSSAVASAASYGDDPEALKYVVPAGQGGTYYIHVESLSTPDDPSYWFRVDIQSPGERAIVTAPAVRKRMRTGHQYVSYGTLQPLHLAGDQSVTVQWQKYSNGRWRAGGTTRSENVDYSSYTRYKVEYSFYGWGSGSMRWRVRAMHLKDAMHPRAVSAWRYFSVSN
jgi:hypothetical protein